MAGLWHSDGLRRVCSPKRRPDPDAERRQTQRWRTFKSPHVTVDVQIKMSHGIDTGLACRLGARKTAHTGGPDGSDQERVLNIYICLFLLLGLVFGLSTFSYRHLFSEGPHQVDAAEAGAAWGARVLWAMVCTFLWPIMVLTGLNSARILAKRKRQAVSPQH